MHVCERDTSNVVILNFAETIFLSNMNQQRCLEEVLDKDQRFRLLSDGSTIVEKFRLQFLLRNETARRLNVYSYFERRK